MAILDAGSWCWCWGQAAKAAAVCGRVMAAEACSMAALELAEAVAALVVVALERDKEEVPSAAGSGPVCTW